MSNKKSNLHVRVLLIADYPLPMQQGFSAYTIKVISLIIAVPTCIQYISCRVGILPARPKNGRAGCPPHNKITSVMHSIENRYNL